MSTELHAALREAVSDAPFDESDLRTVIDAGSRRLRRRATVRAGASALLVAALVASVAVVSGRSDTEPRPAHVVRLDLNRAQNQHLDVLASVRTTLRDPANELDHDRFEGLTTDGLVLRSRYTYHGNVTELGLLDPETGRTHWLPRPPRAPQNVVELTADQLVLFANVSERRSDLLMFDRPSETWTSIRIQPPEGIEVHTPPQLAIAPDGRFYLGHNLEDESGPMHWWSYALPEGGEGRPEPALDGESVAWEDGLQARVNNDGRVVLSSSAGERVVAEERPAGCARPADRELTDIPPTVRLAGTRPVVMYVCGDELHVMTAVYDVDRGEVIQVAGADARAADEDHVLLGADRSKRTGVYLLDLDRLTLARIGPGTYEPQTALVNGLVLWNRAGPLDDKDTYDALWKVARLPRGS
ncbi:hypothetical protein EKO23_08160 [Nocardioides guangzhouensis]|uniref:WD40 repeat domain-containing protein n=1 Tax=Nocardioides guangzhouensis TaxID=2497878 RepID=A0A4V1XZJ1_9ACTN|nr:hypothetical protein [Nocardioides guangzhouensis]RYP86929.1 hypothetical protein EKO23_08160 [Nocardioides guangzhouensis]